MDGEARVSNEVLQSFVNSKGYHRFVLFEEEEGVYIFVYESGDAPGPIRDHLQDTWEIAKAQCLNEYGVPMESWRRADDRPHL
jgi:hypothetical protein